MITERWSWPARWMRVDNKPCFEKMKNGGALSIVAVLVLHHCALILPSFAAQQKMIVLKQTHREYGRVTTYITSQAVKVVNHERRFTFLSRAPDWDILLYNDQRKNMHRFVFK